LCWNHLQGNKIQFTNLVSEAKYKPEQFPLFAETWNVFFKKNGFRELFIDKEDDFLGFFVKKLPKHVKKNYLQNLK